MLFVLNAELFRVNVAVDGYDGVPSQAVTIQRMGEEDPDVSPP